MRYIVTKPAAVLAAFSAMAVSAMADTNTPTQITDLAAQASNTFTTVFTVAAVIIAVGIGVRLAKRWLKG